jgi:hypothetical protein
MKQEYTNTLLIAPSELKSESLINNNVDDKPLGVMVQTVQEIYLSKITGTALMRRLQELVYNKIQNDQGDRIDGQGFESYAELLEDYVKDYIKYRVMKNFLVENSFKMRNIGLVRNADTNVIPADVDTLKYLEHHYDVYVAEYEERLSNYLCANRSNFPELAADIPSYMDAPTLGKDFSGTGGLWLGKSSKDKSCGTCKH